MIGRRRAGHSVLPGWVPITMLAAVALPAGVARARGADAGVADGSAGVDGARGDAAMDAGADAGALTPVRPVVTAPRLVPLRARVVAKGTREPLAGASITIDAEPAGEADADGWFDVRVRPGRRHVQIQHPGYDSIDEVLEAPPPVERTFRLAPRQTGERYETVVNRPDERASRTSIQDEELTQTPGSFGDPFRVVESLPGVSQVVWPLAIYAIRGANPGNTGFFVDGVRVPALFHFALGPSVIHPYFLKQVDFYPGGYSSEYGRYVSGIVTARTASPETDRVHASADVRLFDAGGIVATPFDGGRGTMAVAGRFAYTGLIFSVLSPDLVFNYWDYQARIEHTLGSGRLTLFVFGSSDLLRSQVNPQDLNVELWFHRASLRWEGSLLGGRLALGLVGGADSSRGAFCSLASGGEMMSAASTAASTCLVSLPLHVTSQSVAPRLGYSHPISWWADVDVGADGEFHRIRPTTENGGALAKGDLFAHREVLEGGAYVGLTLRTRSRLVVSPSMRYEAFREQGVQRFEPSPRLNVRVRPAGDVWLKASVGRYAQLASLPVGVPGFEQFGLATFGPQTSLQGSVGVEAPLGESMSLDATTFYQRLKLTDLESIFDLDVERPNVVELRDGESYGIEVMIRRNLGKRLHGWLAYTLSKSDRLIGFYRVKAASDWDQRHIFNLVLGYRLTHGWEVSGRAHYNTGRPYPVSDDRYRVEYQRLPSFFQLDGRVDKHFVFDKFVLAAYFELVNGTFTREVFDLRRTNGKLEEKAFRIALPSIGIHAEW